MPRATTATATATATTPAAATAAAKTRAKSTKKKAKPKKAPSKLAQQTRQVRAQKYLSGFGVPAPVTGPGQPWTTDALRAFNNACCRHTVKSNVAIHEASRKRCADGNCVCFTSQSKRFQGKRRDRHYFRKVTAPKFQAMIDGLDSLEPDGVHACIEAMVYKDSVKFGRSADSVSQNAAAVARAVATATVDRHLLFATNRYYYGQVLLDIDLDLHPKRAPAPLTLSDEVALSEEFMQQKFAPAIAAIVCGWLNEVGVRVDANGYIVDQPVTPADLLIVTTDGQPKLSNHVHCGHIAMQTSWAKDLFVPAVLRPIIERVAPEFFTWLRRPDDDTVLASIFDKAPLAGSMFRFFGCTKSAKPDAGRGTPMRCDPNTGHFTLRVPMEEAAPLTLATNVASVETILLPKSVVAAVVGEAEAAANADKVWWAPSDEVRARGGSAGNSGGVSVDGTIANTSQHHLAFAAETAEERDVLAAASRAFEHSFGVRPHVYFVNGGRRDDALVDEDDAGDDNDDGDGDAAAADDDSDDDDDDGDDDAPARRLVGFDPLDAKDGLSVLQKFWGDSDNSGDEWTARLAKLDAAIERSETRTFYPCAFCVAASGTCSYFGHAHTIFVGKNQAVYLKCQRMHGQKKDVDIDASAKQHSEKPSTVESMVRLGITQFPGFAACEQEAINQWFVAETESGLTPLNQRCLRRGHGQHATTRRFITEYLPTENLYIGRGDGFVCVTPAPDDPTRRQVAQLSSLASCYASATARFVEVRVSQKGEQSVEASVQPPPFFDELIRTALLQGQPDISLKLPSLQYVSYAPVVCPDGSIHCSEGVAPGTSVYCAWQGGVVPPTAPSADDLRALLDDFDAMLGSFQWQRAKAHQRLEESACLVWVAATQQRHCIAAGIIDLLLKAQGKNAGKTTLSELLQLLALNTLGTSVPTIKETPTGRAVTISEQTFNTVYSDGSTQVLSMGNIEDDAQFRSATLEDAKTKDKISFRGYHTQRLKHASARLSMLADGNGVEMMDGLARRFLPLLLQAGSTRAAMSLDDEHTFKRDLDVRRTAAFPRTARALAQLVAELVRSSRKAQQELLGEFHAAGHKVCLQGSLDRAGDVHFDLVRAALWHAFGRDKDATSWYVDPFDWLMEEAVGAGAAADGYATVVAACYDAITDLAHFGKDLVPEALLKRAASIVAGEPFTWGEALDLIRPEGSAWLRTTSTPAADHEPPLPAPTAAFVAAAAEAHASLVACLHALKNDKDAASMRACDAGLACKELTARHTLCPKLKRFVDKVVSVTVGAGAGDEGSTARKVVRLVEFEPGAKGRPRRFCFDEPAAGGKRKRCALATTTL